MEIVFMQQLLVSILLGALIGIEREYHKGIVGVGIRTSIFIALIGTISTYLAITYNFIWLLYFSAIGAVIFGLMLFWYRVKEQKHHVGMTTSTTVIVIFLIGVLVGLNLITEATVLSVIVFALLFLKTKFVYSIKHLTEDEITSAIQFAVLAFVIYPLIPDKEFYMINFKQVWEIIIIVSFISFLGFLAIRKFGKRNGIILTSIFGSIYTSNATSMTLINKMKKSQRLQNLLVFVLISGITVMVMRNIFIGIILTQSPITIRALVEFISIAAVYFAVVLYLIWKKVPKVHESDIEYKSPFAIKPALIFGVLFLIILFLSKVVVLYFGSGSFVNFSIIGGMVNSAGTTATASLLFMEGTLPLHLFIQSIIFSCIGAMLSIVIYAFIFSSKKTGINLIKYLAAFVGLLVLFLFI